jgi:hypothetical protein
MTRTISGSCIIHSSTLFHHHTITTTYTASHLPRHARPSRPLYCMAPLHILEFCPSVCDVLFIYPLSPFRLLSYLSSSLIIYPPPFFSPHKLDALNPSPLCPSHTLATHALIHSLPVLVSCSVQSPSVYLHNNNNVHTSTHTYNTHRLDSRFSTRLRLL